MKIVPNESIYEASPRTLMDIINGLDNTKSFAVIFGHNPGLTYIAEYLTGAVIGNIPTAGCVLIRFEVDAWSHISKDSGTLVWEQFPEGEEN
ncbi:MAG: hypothetical protein K2Q22_06820 [Cytophagales bacterium]|nr:hypothetical protein [Cytophagales bacterium]